MEADTIRTRIQDQLKHGHWDVFVIYKQVLRYPCDLAARMRELSGDPGLADMAQSLMQTRPYGLVYKFPFLIVWRMYRDSDTKRVHKQGYILVIADDSPLLDVLPKSASPSAPPHLQKWAYMFFRQWFETKQILVALDVLRARRLGIKLPDDAKDAWAWTFIWHPTAPVCFVRRNEGRFVCTRHGWWRTGEFTFCREILPLPGPVAELRAIMIGTRTA